MNKQNMEEASVKRGQAHRAIESSGSKRMNDSEELMSTKERTFVVQQARRKLKCVSLPLL